MTAEMRKRAIELLEENIKGLWLMLSDEQINFMVRKGLVYPNGISEYIDFTNDKIKVYGEVVNLLKEIDNLEIMKYRDCLGCTSYRISGDEEWCTDEGLLFQKYPCDCYEKKQEETT